MLSPFHLTERLIHAASHIVLELDYVRKREKTVTQDNNCTLLLYSLIKIIMPVFYGSLNSQSFYSPPPTAKHAIHKLTNEKINNWS